MQNKRLFQRAAKPEPKPEPAPKPDPAVKPQPATTDWAPSGMLYKDVYRFAAEHIAAGYIHKNYEPPSGSKLDSAIATRLAVCNYTQNQITAAIAAGSPTSSVPDYAAKKAAEPFSTTQAQVAKYADRADGWKKEEKKDAIKAQKDYAKNGIAVPSELKKPKQSHSMSM